MPPVVVDAGNHAGSSRRSPARNKGRRYPADPPTIEEIVAVMRHYGNGLHGHRLRGLIVVRLSSPAAESQRSGFARGQKRRLSRAAHDLFGHQASRIATGIA